MTKKTLAKFKTFNGKRYMKIDTTYNNKTEATREAKAFRRLGFSVRTVPHKVKRKQKYSLYARSRLK